MTDSGNCKEGKLFDDSCYVLVGEAKTWYQAEFDCRYRGGHLVNIEDSRELHHFNGMYAL